MKKLLTSLLFVGLLFVGGKAFASHGYPVGYFTTSSTGLVVSTDMPFLVKELAVSTGLPSTQVVLVATNPTISSTGGIITSPLSYGALSSYEKGQWLHPPVLLMSTGTTGELNSVQTYTFPGLGVEFTDGLFLYQSAGGATVTIYITPYQYYDRLSGLPVSIDEAKERITSNFKSRGIKVTWAQGYEE